MRKCAILFMAFISIIFIAAPAFAQVQAVEYDPLKRNLLFVEGESEKEFPVNLFRLKFGFDIQKGNFSEANAYSSQITDTINTSIKSLGLTDVRVIKGWDIVKQAKISIGASGSKLSNQLIIEVRDFPAGKLQELIVKIIDRCLVVDKEVFLEGVEVGITEDAEDKDKEEVLMDALKRLKANAEKAAGTQGKKVIAAKRVFVFSKEGGIAPQQVHSYDVALEYEEKAMNRSYLSVQKGFSIRSNITDHIKISAKVTGIYEIE
jgi:hypothetical protein